LYPAEFGGKASALINVVTKSGGKDVHGSAVEFLRNDKFDARNYFDDPGKAIPPLRQNQFGATLGGPIRRERAFYFLSYEGQRIHRSLTQTFSVAPDALRTGNFAGLVPLCDPLTRPPQVARHLRTIRFQRTGSTRWPSRCCKGSRRHQRGIGSNPWQSADKQPDDQFSLKIDHALSAADNTLAASQPMMCATSAIRTSSLNEVACPGFGAPSARRLVTCAGCAQPEVSERGGSDDRGGQSAE
jgi:hypothetical protein